MTSSMTSSAIKKSVKSRNFWFIWKRTFYWTKNITTKKPEFHFIRGYSIEPVLPESQALCASGPAWSSNLLQGKFDEGQKSLKRPFKVKFRLFRSNIFCSVERSLSNKPKIFRFWWFFNCRWRHRWRHFRTKLLL